MGLPNAGMSGFTHEGVTSGLTLNSGAPSASMQAMPEGGGVAVTKPAGRPMTSGERESSINKRAAFGDDAAKNYKGELARNGVDTSFSGNSPVGSMSGPDLASPLRKPLRDATDFISRTANSIGNAVSGALNFTSTNDNHPTSMLPKQKQQEQQTLNQIHSRESAPQ